MIDTGDPVAPEASPHPAVNHTTKGVILYVLEEDKAFLVEFFDENGETIGDGMETVYAYQIIKYNKAI